MFQAQSCETEERPSTESKQLDGKPRTVETFQEMTAARNTYRSTR